MDTDFMFDEFEAVKPEPVQTLSAFDGKMIKVLDVSTIPQDDKPATIECYVGGNGFTLETHDVRLRRAQIDTLADGNVYIIKGSKLLPTVRKT